MHLSSSKALSFIIQSKFEVTSYCTVFFVNEIKETTNRNFLRLKIEANMIASSSTGWVFCSIKLMRQFRSRVVTPYSNTLKAKKLTRNKNNFICACIYKRHFSIDFAFIYNYVCKFKTWNFNFMEKSLTIVVEIHLGKKSRSKRATCISTDANQSAGDNEYFK